jgi:hypothetical protein
MNAPPITFEDHGSRGLYALFKLQNNMAINKSLFNLQLAATHVAFMLDSSPGHNVGTFLFL